LLCQFAREFPDFVASFLGSGRGLGRRFREESVTDLMMSGLKLMGGNSIRIRFPNEPVTGADMQWDFVNKTTGAFFRLRIQAKQVYGEGKFWKRHSYRELLKRDRFGVLQADTLINSAKTTPVRAYPLYALYHARESCDLAASTGVSHVEGVNLANGSDILKLARAGKRNLGAVAPHLYSLRDLFCPQKMAPLGPFALGGGQRDTLLRLMLNLTPRFLPPSPEDIRKRLEAKISPADNNEIPEITHQIPMETNALIEGDDRRIGFLEPDIGHVVFISEDFTLPRPG
jgi:hypothetical protein